MEKGSFQQSESSKDSRESRDHGDFREPPDCGKQRRSQPFSSDSREFRDSGDSSSERTPFSGPDKRSTGLGAHNSPPNSLRFSDVMENRCDNAIHSAMFQRKKRPIAVWLATGTVATEDRGDLELRSFVLSGLPWCPLELELSMKRRTGVYTQTDMRTHTHTHTYMRAHTHMHTSTHAHMHTCTHAHTHTHPRTRTRTHALSGLSRHLLA